MSYSDTITANALPYLRDGSLAERADAIAKIEATDQRMGFVESKEWRKLRRAGGRRKRCSP